MLNFCTRYTAAISSGCRTEGLSSPPGNARIIGSKRAT